MSALGASILGKFVESPLFSNQSNGSASSPNLTHPSTPTKLTTPQTSINYSFFQFAFKFLINYDQEKDMVEVSTSSQVETIRLFDANLDQFLEVNRRTDGWLLSSVIMALTWCLTSKTSSIRLSSLRLIEKLNERLDEENVIWKNFLKKVLKYREEIEMDGGDYIRTKFNKILSSDEKLSVTIIDYLKKFLVTSLKSGSPISRVPNSPQHLAQFSSNLDSSSDIDVKCLVLVKFKLILLDLFALVDDTFKIKLFESVFGLLMTSINESSSLTDSTSSSRLGLELRLNRALLDLIVDPYLLNSKSYSFLNKNEKYFDYLVGYLNNNSQEKSAQLLRYFKQRFMAKLGAENDVQLEFWSRLQARMQVDLLKCTFDLWLCNSSRSVESSLVTSESIQENIDYLDSIKHALVSFKLVAQHYVCLLVERASMDVIAPGDSTLGINTTKEMRKQMKKVLTLT